MNSSFLKLNTADLAKGASLAVIVVLLGALQQALLQHGWDFAAYNWGSIANLAITAFLGYLGKNLVSTPDGAVLGAFGKPRD